MRTSIATTTGFHLRRLAVELDALGDEIDYFSYLPAFRLRRDGLGTPWAHSLFRPLLPQSAMALLRGSPWQTSAVEAMLARTDAIVERRLAASDVFVGLSSMAVRSASRARHLGAKVVIERGSRHVESQNELLTESGGLGLSDIYIKRELASYAEADVITVPSQHAAESFVERGFERSVLHVCPLGVDLDLFATTPRLESSGLRLLFVGGWSHQKGVDVLLEAHRQRPEWHLTHVGVEAGLSVPRDTPRFTSLGHQSHASLRRIMAHHHVLVLPSRQDGFGMVLLEALAAGLPVVGSSMTGAHDIQERIQDPRWVELVRPGDVDDLLRGIDTIWERDQDRPDPSDRNRLSATDRDYFSWRGYGSRYRRYLRTLVGEASS